MKVFLVCILNIFEDAILVWISHQVVVMWIVYKYNVYVGGGCFMFGIFKFTFT
jgi:hypothetical protein